MQCYSKIIINIHLFCNLLVKKVSICAKKREENFFVILLATLSVLFRQLVTCVCVCVFFLFHLNSLSQLLVAFVFFYYCHPYKLVSRIVLLQCGHTNHTTPNVLQYLYTYMCLYTVWIEIVPFGLSNINKDLQIEASNPGAMLGFRTSWKHHLVTRGSWQDQRKRFVLMIVSFLFIFKNDKLSTAIG